MAISLIPLVAAAEGPFPDITFQVFNQFVEDNFSSKITLSQVLVVLFTITDNPELLTLHAWQQNTRFRIERSTSNSGWIWGLARALLDKFGDEKTVLFQDQEEDSEDEISEEDEVLDQDQDQVPENQATDGTAQNQMPDDEIIVTS